MGIESMLAKVSLWEIILKQHIFCVCMGGDLSQDSNGHLEVKAVVNQTWWHIIPALERLDPEYLKFDSSVGYIISVSKSELCGKALSQTQKTKSNRFWQNLTKFGKCNGKFQKCVYVSVSLSFQETHWSSGEWISLQSAQVLCKIAMILKQHLRKILLNKWFSFVI